jgi:hypothetical protein
MEMLSGFVDPLESTKALMKSAPIPYKICPNDAYPGKK